LAEIQLNKFGIVEKVLFNRKERKDVAKNAKLRHINSALCELCVLPLRPLRLKDFDLFNSPQGADFRGINFVDPLRGASKPK
jgi:hypothetical protein